MKQLLVCMALFWAFCLNAQFSKTHYIPPVSHADAQEPQGQSLYISCPSITPINFILKPIGGTPITGTVSRDIPFVYDIGFGADTQMMIDKAQVGQVQHNKGFVIEADDVVYATVRYTSTPEHFQAGSIVSKGIAALGTRFRVGGFTNTNPPAINDNHYTFATVMATENGTTVNFSNIKVGSSLINVGSNTVAPIVLNAFETYAIAVSGPSAVNRDALIGALITSDKDIVVNCGSFAGSNAATGNIDLGTDQIVPAKLVGTEYIFIKGQGGDPVEQPLLIADEPNTEIYLNGSSTATVTLAAGEYLALNGSAYSVTGNLYVRASKPVFAYQGLGGGTGPQNQNMHFVPPLSCKTPSSINNIPKINEVSTLTNFFASLCLVTRTGSTLSFIVDGVNFTVTELATQFNLTLSGPNAVTGNANYVTYAITSTDPNFGLTGNVSAISDNELYLSYYGSSGAATYGGFYSGFTFKPQITLSGNIATNGLCLPNVSLDVSSLNGFDTFDWFLNGNQILNVSSNQYVPTQPGYYYVRATITNCTQLISDVLPISLCPPDMDSDTIPDAVDVDNDNDGITNCTESLGDQNLDLTNLAAGTVSVSSYSNSFTGTTNYTGTGTAINPSGTASGVLTFNVPAGVGNDSSYELQFATPLHLSASYVPAGNVLLSPNSKLQFVTDPQHVLTVVNPQNSILIDTNYDGIYESGVTQFSSFDIRFIPNSAQPLAANEAAFLVSGYDIKKLTVHLINRSDLVDVAGSVKIFASCITIDTDGDGFSDQTDWDSDNDGIPDVFEASTTALTLSTTDANHDGMWDVYGAGIVPVDTDADSIPDYVDLDSDNDGIYDFDESGASAADINHDGQVDSATYNPNGLAGIINNGNALSPITYAIWDTDANGIPNYRSIDSDADGCFDVTEAGFVDVNNDGIVGNTIPTVTNLQGVVTSSSGYLTPAANVTISAPISISLQPTDQTVCEFQNAAFTIVNTAVDTIQWEVSTDAGVSWSSVVANAVCSGESSGTLTFTQVPASYSANLYRAHLTKAGNTCGLYSQQVKLISWEIPVLLTPLTFKQCDDDTDGITTINLLTYQNQITAQANMTFTYFNSQLGAQNADATDQITNPAALQTASRTIWVRVTNPFNCYTVGSLQLQVSATQLPSTSLWTFTVCDDNLDADGNNTAQNSDIDGIASFDFSSVTTAIQNLLPPSGNFTISFYKNQADALALIDATGQSLALTNITTYRNRDYPTLQNVWVRVSSTSDNACFGLGPYVKLVVEPLPVVHLLGTTNMIRQCDDNGDGFEYFNTTTIEADLLQGQTNMAVTYWDAQNRLLTSPLPNPFYSGSQVIKVRFTPTNSAASNGPCWREGSFQLQVDSKPKATPIPTNQTTFCDDEPDPALQDGSYPFVTTSFESQIVGNQTQVQVTYRDGSGQLLLSPLPDPFPSSTQNVEVRVENPLNTNCYSATSLNFVVHEVPNIPLTGDGKLCLNIPGQVLPMTSGLPSSSNLSNFTFVWTKSPSILPLSVQPNYSATTGGVFSVKVTNQFGCFRTRSYTISASEIARIQKVYVEDLQDDNTVTLVVTGVGDYVFAMDNTDQFQTSPVFTSVAIGVHTVYVKDMLGCGTQPVVVYVLGIPKFFTPNGDGYNDVWNLKGAGNSFESKSMISVFDRFGKLITQFKASNDGWNGTYNGNMMPADDYWYVIELADGREVKGHFALKR
ncbi:MAG: gliding motility protein [Flavobacterium sp. BFFFF2]|nr:MAG: gliding motility protein [Flavobacterium sp. BFFFF2]